MRVGKDSIYRRVFRNRSDGRWTPDFRPLDRTSREAKMRRILSAALYSVPTSGAKGAASIETEGFSVEMELRCATPVIGGGVEAYGPDVVDYVRVPGIRGQLRGFWRALAPTPLEPNELFKEEIAQWGGVTQEKGRRSRVEVRVEVDRERPGREYPAGWHEPQAGGVGFKSLPTWKSRALGYALFPLQKPRSELNAATGNAPRVATKSLKEGMAFRLRLRVIPSENAAKDPARCEEQRLLGALFCWVFLGGLGGRTTRGFGALEVIGEVSLCGLDPSLVQAWKALFRGPHHPKDTERWLGEALCQAGLAEPFKAGDFEWATLHGVNLVAGPGQKTAEAAQGLLVKSLQTFRQGERVGRDPGTGSGRPGESRWPEPDLLRRLFDPRARWEHRPEPEPVNECAPRAAFGLPIVVSFKDRVDSSADATLEFASGPKNGGGKNCGTRWTSPVRLRPVKCQNGDWVPLVVALERRPEKIRINYKNAPRQQASQGREVPVNGSSGARSPISEFLTQSQGDSVDAFLHWLAATQGFSRTGGGK